MKQIAAAVPAASQGTSDRAAVCEGWDGQQVIGADARVRWLRR